MRMASLDKASDRYQGRNAGKPRAGGKLQVFGKELPDIDTDEQFQAYWKITKAKEVKFTIQFRPR